MGNVKFNLTLQKYIWILKLCWKQVIGVDGFFDSVVQIHVGVYGIFILVLLVRHSYDTGNLHI